MDGENKPALVELRDRRAVIIAELSTHFTNDVLGLAEFEERVDLAHRATAVGELDSLIADLGPAIGHASQASVVRTGAPVGNVRSFVSSVQRKGAWPVPERLRVSTVMGAIDLDFREAEFGAGVSEVRIKTVMGAVSITVPPDLTVECAGRTVLGHFENMHQRGPDEGPVLRITGMAVMGAVEISSGEQEQQ